MKKILIVFTGGTFSMMIDEQPVVQFLDIPVKNSWGKSPMLKN